MSRDGFTLVEALVAVTIGSVIVLLASTLFLIQNDYYNWTLERTRTQDNARSISELVAEDLRSVVPGSFVVADSKRMVVRRPVAIGVVCDRFGIIHSLHIPGGLDSFTPSDVSGFALRSAGGTWSFTARTWSAMYLTTFFAPFLCENEGADTVGASDEFYLFGDLASMAGTSTSAGDLVMFYRNLELRFAPSQLDSTTWALYRGTSGGTLVEFATGVSEEAHFAYRTGDTTHAAAVTGAARASIDGVRVYSLTEATVRSGTREDVDFDLVTDLLLRNAG